MIKEIVDILMAAIAVAVGLPRNLPGNNRRSNWPYRGSGSPRRDV